MAVPTASDFSDANTYCAACLIDTNTGTKNKSQCKLPVRDANGSMSQAGMQAAAGALGGMSMPSDMKAAAAKKLMGMMDKAGMTPPANLKSMMGGQ